MKAALVSLVYLLSFCPLLPCAELAKKWLVFYGETAPFAQLASYQLVVFDSDRHPPLEGLREKNITTLGYLSLGEVENYRFYFEQVKQEGILRGENPNWKGSQFIDIRDSRWAKRVIEQLIPHILFQGFSGVFLDTLDNAEFLEEQNPHRYKGMKQAAIDLVKAIRFHYPQIKIMVNRAYALLPQLAKVMDMEAGESVYSTYNFAAKRYERVSKDSYQQQVTLLQQAQLQNPSLGIYTIDYWDPGDVKEIENIYTLERDNGFNPYVAPILLDTIIAEPRGKTHK